MWSRRASARRRIVVISLLLAAASAASAADDLKLPGKPGSVKFAVIGDSGTGDTPQYDIAKLMVGEHQRFPFDFVLMLGDNMYGGESPADFVKKFERPYKPLLDAGVKFYASLGNHDDPNKQLAYPPFNMNGARYYTFAKGPVRFFALDSNFMDPQQRMWLEQELQRSAEPWKICYFHHPLYSSGERHGPDVELRGKIEPLFIKYGVTVVFAGHEHFYERIKPQHGITYFTNGGAAKLREGNIDRGSSETAVGFDADRSFMIVEIAGDELYFQAIARTGKTIDSGTVARTARVEAVTPTR